MISAPPPPRAGSEGELSEGARVALAAASAVPARGRKCLYRHRGTLRSADVEGLAAYATTVPNTVERAELLDLLARVDDAAADGRVQESDEPVLKGFGIQITEATYNKDALVECDFVANVRTAVTGSRFALVAMSYTSRDTRGLVATVPIVLARIGGGWRVRYVGEGTLITAH